MRHLLTAILFVIFFYHPCSAQDKSLVAQGATPDLYLLHEILSKENYYSVGRMYNIPPKELGTYNHLPFEKGLSLGQTIKVPLTQNNFSQGEATTGEQALIPIYHIVQPKEGLYRISLAYNKVPLDLLKKWNNLTGDVVSNGTKLIIGYLKVIKEQSPLSQQGVSVTAGIAAKPKEDKTAHKKQEVIKEVIKEKQPNETMPEKVQVVAKTPDVKIQKEMPKEKPKETPREEPKEMAKEEPKDEIKTSSDKPIVDFAGGFFKKLYNSQAANKTIVHENGLAGVFKTTSGWTDGKYYCFHNEATPGTVLKITNSLTGKSVYAKVLDAVPDIKQNNGLLLRLSNSAAEELGAGETKFDCSVTYTK